MKPSRWSVLAIGLLILVLVAACNQQTTDNGLTVEAKHDETLYHLFLRIENLPESHSSLNASFSGYNGSSYGTMWEEGKGQVRGIADSIEPQTTFASPEDLIILKTTDWKAMMVRPGDVAEFRCLADYEPVCSKQENGTLGQCAEIWEFDFCRLVSVSHPIQ